MLSHEKAKTVGLDLVSEAKAARRAALAEDQARLDAVWSACAIPDECGPDIAPAPARGGFVVEQQFRMVPNGVDTRGLDKWAVALTGHGHRSTVRAADVFDRMIANSLRCKRPCPLTAGQISMGRRYAALVELAGADGTKVQRLDASLAGGDGMGWMDRHLDIARELTILRNRIGAGMAMSVRRIRPSDRGETRRGPIMDRTLIDMVCLRDKSLEQVLLAHGWEKNARTHKALIAALSDALDRMIGYRVKKSS